MDEYTAWGRFMQIQPAALVLRKKVAFIAVSPDLS
jgi:hypothetical protein